MTGHNFWSVHQSCLIPIHTPVAGRLGLGQNNLQLGGKAVDPHEQVSKLPEQSTLSGLGHSITNHVPSGALFVCQLLLIDTVSDKVEPDINVLHTLAARGFVILLQNDCTLVVLEDNVLSDEIPLGLRELLGPADAWHAVIDTHQLRFS